MRKLWLLLFVLPVGLALYAEAVSRPKTYLLRYKFKPGQVLRYRVSTSYGASSPVKRFLPKRAGALTSSIMVEAVRPDGTALLTGDEWSILWENDLLPRAGALFSVEMDARGELRTAPKVLIVLLSSKTPSALLREYRVGNRPLGPQNLVTNLFHPLPIQALRVGGTWYNTLERMDHTNLPIYTRSRFVRIETRSGKETARIERSYVLPVEGEGQTTRTQVNGNIAVSEEMNLTLDTGQVVYRRTRAQGTLIRDAAVRAAQVDFQATVTMERLP